MRTAGPVLHLSLMASERARERCRERIIELAEGAGDLFEIRFAIVATLRPVVGFDRWCWPITDPASGLGTTAVGEHDYWPSLTRLLLLDQRVEEPNALPVLERPTTLAEETQGNYSRSLRWVDVLDPIGVGDEMRVPLRDGHGLWGCLDLMRDAADGRFTEEDRALLDELAPTLASVTRRSAATMAAGPWSGAPTPGAGVFVLDTDLGIRATTPGARAWLDGMVPPGIDYADSAARAVVYNVASRTLARRAGFSPTGPARVRVRSFAGPWAVIEGEELEGAGSGSGSVAVTIRPAAPEEILDLRFQAHDLTARERELVTLLLAGHDTRSVSERMFLSRHTVQDHLKSVFRKVRVGSRKELIASLLGPGASEG
jgi:DNA-binding CsgD family transcriptional regulator